MRITGGFMGGRRIRVPRKGVRPTQEKVRAAIFSSIAERVPGASFLDLFAGSGSTGLEALSRGASSVCWVESDRRTARILRENIQIATDSPDLPKGVVQLVIEGDALRFLKNSEKSFDIIFADPPYDEDGAWLKKLLAALDGKSTLNRDGIFIMEQRSFVPVPDMSGWTILKNKRYGESRVLFFKRDTPEQ
jgi:16S rRNA (guanine966-N2)-methyltransferase